MSEPTPEEELMIRDQLDDLLDAAAPAVTTITADDVRAMVLAARSEVPKQPRARRAAILSGALAVLLVGGAGVATASGDWLWSDGLENPDRSYSYTSPTWGECEIRFSQLDTHNPLIQADVDRIIDGWFATTDVEAAAAPFVDDHLRQIESDQAAAVDEVLDPRQPDLNSWFSHDAALSQALYEELKAHGYDSGAGDLEGAEAHSQVHCEGEDWGGEGGTP
ncbi:hypothetical protein [Microbacterium sp. W4I20]|uniref:hypothetical protein n=1 Tax=Microbacterium sp. W4I20 TaxID=3042262 RepID=UPI002782A643|nr:hypothetical protein [Microbacterium sp. W4I20]MDQ0725613.1 hypothetical protein [Microbacterium sp. W4I20]